MESDGLTSTHPDHINNKDLETLIIASIQTLKRAKQKCGKEEVFNLVIDSINDDISKEMFENILMQLIDNKSVKLNIIGDRTCLSIPKENVSINEISSENLDKQNECDVVGTQIENEREIENENEIDNSNTTTNYEIDDGNQPVRKEDSIDNKLKDFKESVLKEFNSFKTMFFTEVNHMKSQLLSNYKPHNINTSTDNFERLITILQENNEFLKEQLKQKDKIIDNLFKQLSRNDDFIKLTSKTEQITEALHKQVENDQKTESTQTEEMTEYTHNSLSIALETSDCEDSNRDKEPLIQESHSDMTKEDHPEKDKQEKNITNKDHSQKESLNSIDKDKKSVVVLGDSMLKLLNGYEMSKRVNSDCNVYVKSFSGATTQCMEDYIKPSLRKNPNHFIIHVGTNDLATDKTPEGIAEKIVNLATAVKSETCDVSISSIILRTDNKQLNQKGVEVNAYLKDLCKEKNIYFINNSKRIKAQHLNQGRLHLNRKGSNILSSIFVNEICKILN